MLFRDRSTATHTCQDTEQTEQMEDSLQRDCTDNDVAVCADICDISSVSVSPKHVVEHVIGIRHNRKTRDEIF